MSISLSTNQPSADTGAASAQSSLVDTLTELSQDEITLDNVQEKFQAFLAVLQQYSLSEEERDLAGGIIAQFQNFASDLEESTDRPGITINPESLNKAMADQNNRVFVLQFLNVLLNIHTATKNVQGANDVMTQILQKVSFPNLTKPESDVVAEMIASFSGFALGQESPMELLGPIQGQTQDLFDQTIENSETRAVALQAAYTISKIHIQNEDSGGIKRFMGKNLMPNLLQIQLTWPESNVVAEMMARSRIFVSRQEPQIELLGTIQKQMQDLFAQTIEDPKTRAVALQAAHTILEISIQKGDAAEAYGALNAFLPHLLKSGPGIRAAAEMIARSRILVSCQEPQIELPESIQEQMQELFAQTIKSPQTQAVALQAAHTILEIHIQNGDSGGIKRFMDGNLMPSLLQIQLIGQESNIVAKMIERSRMLVSCQKPSMELLGPIQKQMQDLFAQTIEDPKTQAVAFQTAYTILEIHIQKGDVAEAYGALNAFLPHLLKSGPGIRAAAKMIANLREKIPSLPADQRPIIQKQMQELFAQTIKSPQTQAVAFQTAYTTLEISIQNKNETGICEALNYFLPILLRLEEEEEGEGSPGIQAAAQMIENLRERIPSLPIDLLEPIQGKMQDLFAQTIKNPQTQIVAFQALHALIHCDPRNLPGVVERIPEAANDPIFPLFVDYVFRTPSPDKLIIPFLQCLNQRVPSNDTSSLLPPNLHEIQKPLEGEDICTIILNRSSVKAPPGVRFYLEAQTNSGQVGTCGLHALRHYVGTQWISLSQLDSIKFQAPASQAALRSAIGNITQILPSIEIPEGSVLGQKILDLRREISNMTPAEKLLAEKVAVSEIVLATRGFVSLLTNGSTKNFDAPEVKTLTGAAKTIENDVLSVSAGGVDGDVLLAALKPLDDDTQLANLETLGLGDRVDYEEIFQVMDAKLPSVDRAIILAGTHFVPIRKNAEGTWHIVDGIIGIVPRGRVKAALGNDGNTVLNGIIYSPRENLGAHLISRLGSYLAPSIPLSQPVPD